MTIEQLGALETELCSTVINIHNSEQTPKLDRKLEEIFEAYKRIHQNYAEIALKDNEALKRGMFIQWYVQTEPSYLTGINDIDPKAERIIFEHIEEKIQDKSIDDELFWMLNYYASWDFVFEKFKDFKGLTNLINNKNENFFPKVIDRNKMSKRGQMGKYWNSLTILGG